MRTRFAPSPTGYLHIGGARTALFSWAQARKSGGEFILRIEDTDLERSSDEASRAIVDSMDWLGLDFDEGPFHQMDRLARYREVADQLLDIGSAYWCYASKDEIEILRETQKKAGLKPKYDGRWRPENCVGQTPPNGVKPVLRFRNPDAGIVSWNDLVKGNISISNEELDDLVIMRSDGIPTYNFGVVVDDWDMRIDTVVRGDDHVNNTPRQINIYEALGATVPKFAHVPMILGKDGERLSKRHGAVSVMQYKQDGFLPQALLNYLARLGWSHGNHEKFSMNEMLEWFELGKVSRSAAKFDEKKLFWLNQKYLNDISDEDLVTRVTPMLRLPVNEQAAAPDIGKIVSVLKDRTQTLVELGKQVNLFIADFSANAELERKYYDKELKLVFWELRQEFVDLDWKKEKINFVIKSIIKRYDLKMSQIAMPVRVMVLGVTQTPSVDVVLELLGREETLRRMDLALGKF